MAFTLPSFNATLRRKCNTVHFKNKQFINLLVSQHSEIFTFTMNFITTRKEFLALGKIMCMKELYLG